MLLTERGRHWTGDALGPVTRGPLMWADGGMVVSVVRQGFFDKPRETMRAFRTHLRCLGNVAGCPEREVGQLSVLALPDSIWQRVFGLFGNGKIPWQSMR